MKILFLQLWYDFYGGAETVNHSLAEQFKKDGYDVKIQCLYKCNKNEIINNYTYIKEYICDEPKRPSYKLMLKSLKKFNFSNFSKDVFKCIKVKKFKKYSIRQLKKSLIEYDANYIIVTNPELIKYVPKNQLKKCLIHMHSGCDEYMKDRKLKKLIFKYEKKVNKLIWLTKGFVQRGIEFGLKNGTYMYNPVRIKSEKLSNLDNNNISFIGRLAPPKRVYLLTQIFNEFYKENKKWNLNIYGSGIDDRLIYNPNIKMHGSISDIKSALLNTSVFALTSSCEGFPMVVLEAYECGIPVITYEFPISCEEVVKDGVTGFVIQMDNSKEYLEKLNLLCGDINLRRKMGKEAKKYVKKFYPEEVSKRWYKLFRGEL